MSLIFFAVLLALGHQGTGAATLPAPAASPVGRCPIGASDWSAHVNAMPGPRARQMLIVTGSIGVKPAARTILRLNPEVMESDPPQYSVTLEIQLPREPTIDSLERREVRGEWPVPGVIGAVHIRCGGRVLTTITQVATAH
jgi:hypothetical protein